MIPGGPAEAGVFRKDARSDSPDAEEYGLLVSGRSRGELAHEGGLQLAKRLGTEAVVFPGAHGGFDSHHAAEFAAKLREVLEG
jgi:hypothetical protein